MYAPTRYHDSEFVRWSVILFLAAMLILAFASVCAAADIPKPSRNAGRLPPSIDPISAGFGETRPTDEYQDLGTTLWSVLRLHSEKRHREAMEAWTRISVPADSRVWKFAAMGQAAVATQNFKLAEDALAEAVALQPANPVVHYLLGVMRLEQASQAVEWPEDFFHRRRFVSYPPLKIVPNSKSMYILAATAEFQKAIANAESIRLDEALIPPHLSRTAALEPTVGDLLLALSADNFEARAHNTLGDLFLESGSLEIAEEHMDAAVLKGMANIFGYQDLANAYRARGQYVDAARANLKAVAHGHHKLNPAFDVLRNLRDAFVVP